MLVQTDVQAVSDGVIHTKKEDNMKVKKKITTSWKCQEKQERKPITKEEIVERLLSSELRQQIYDMDIAIIERRIEKPYIRGVIDGELEILKARRGYLWAELMDRRTAARVMVDVTDNGEPREFGEMEETQ